MHFPGTTEGYLSSALNNNTMVYSSATGQGKLNHGVSPLHSMFDNAGGGAERYEGWFWGKGLFLGTVIRAAAGARGLQDHSQDGVY